MTILKEDIRALNALLTAHYSYWVDTAHTDGVAIRKNSGCVRSGKDITRLLAGLWNDVGYNTIPLISTNTELLRVRCAVVDECARFELVYTNGNGVDATAQDLLCETVLFRTQKTTNYVRTKKINLLITMLDAFNAKRLPVVRRGQVALIK